MPQAHLYPSYVDMDAFLDIPRLQGLDGYITERLEQRLRQGAGDAAFYTGPFLLRDDGAPRPGAQMVYLSRSVREENYYDLGDPAVWRPSAEASEFSELMDFIATLPFKATARMLIIYDGSGRAVTAHRDHDSPELCHEFIWFRTNFAKPFYMLDPATAERCTVRSHSAWFDTVNQFHGADASDGLSFSIRVDGIFTDEFRKLIPDARDNPASSPALWAAQAFASATP